MIDVKVQFDLAPIKAQMNFLQREQVPFAAAGGLTDTAFDAKAGVVAEMPSRFTIRRPWITQGVRVIPATKQKLEATVYDKDPFMGLQETGGTKASIHKRVFDYGDYLAIPLDARKTKSDVVAKQDWPQNLVDPFILTARDGRKYLAVHSITSGKSGPVNVSRARGKQRRDTGTRLMYVLVPRVEMKARLSLGMIGARVSADRWPINFATRMAQGVATAK
jgi:hypothetical protein